MKRCLCDVKTAKSRIFQEVTPSGHATFRQRRINVDSISWRCIDVDALWYKRQVLAWLHHGNSSSLSHLQIPNTRFVHKFFYKWPQFHKIYLRICAPEKIQISLRIRQRVIHYYIDFRPNTEVLTSYQVIISDTFYIIAKTYLYNFDPLKPHFYIVKHLDLVGYTLFFLFLLKNIDYGYLLCLSIYLSIYFLVLSRSILIIISGGWVGG